MKKSSGFTNPPLTQNQKEGFSVFSCDLTCAEWIQESAEDADFLRTPTKKRKKNRKPSTHTKSNQAGRENQVCHIPMELPQKNKTEQKMKPSSRKTLGEACRRRRASPSGAGTGPAAAGSHLPGRWRRVPAWSELARGKAPPGDVGASGEVLK